MIGNGGEVLYFADMKKLALLLLTVSPAFADTAVVEAVAFSNGRFDVTLSHPDTGWEHYADGWRIELADGTILGTRVLAHPHVNEQPFTRSDQIAVPDGVTEVFVRTSDNVDGWADDTTPFVLP
ncbi:hypothetical protein SAMN05444287_3098 [Octadecabacter temperatus]|uniref:Uncharacterized protein n=2 Tax=Octadecabacter temperatus TaxID=1458307 RepID=A0A0K0Y8S1_9RHOB|nr:hypothetical protein OSB_27380 [Octadecabacter temperatus]SIO44682.1 hypothetical protein SAMN05444287_3098 [Octadecabacter temperatus]